MRRCCRGWAARFCSRNSRPRVWRWSSSVLGLFYVDNHALVRVLEILHERDFYPGCPPLDLLQTMVDLFQDNVPIDVLTVTERLRKKGRFESAGGGAYLAELVEDGADRVRMSCTMRRWCGKSGAARPPFRPRDHDRHGELMRTPKTLMRSSTGAEQAIFEIGQRKTTAGFVHINAHPARGVSRRLEQLYERKGTRHRYPDRLYGFGSPQQRGLQPSDLIIIAGASRCGEDGVGSPILAEHVGVRVHRPVAIFSLEMSKEQLVVRFLCSRSTSRFLRSPHRLSRSMMTGRLLTNAAVAFRTRLFILTDTPAAVGIWISVRKRGACRWNWGPGPLSLWTICSSCKYAADAESRQREISEHYPFLKALAKELNRPSDCAVAAEPGGGATQAAETATVRSARIRGH